MNEKNLENQEILEKLIISILKERGEISFEELREFLEEKGFYRDSLYLRRIIADLIRRGFIMKTLSRDRKNKFVYVVTSESL
ncbi:MAG: hypothetical protein ABWJ42_00770 [Sulfolobales archaeon]